MVGAVITVKAAPVLDTPFTVTTTLPVVAPVGTAATICVLLQLAIDVAVVPLKLTVLVPCVAPKFAPAIVTEEPTSPAVGLRLATIGVIVNSAPALATPSIVTTMLPVVAPVGTAATICVLLQLVIDVAAVPLKLTVLVPCVAPKFVPMIVTGEPAAPKAGLRLEIAGEPSTVNGVPLLCTPLTVTTTLPVAAPVGTSTVIDVGLQLVTDEAVIPPNITVLVPWAAPKFVPAIVTEPPTGPEAGLRLLIAGVGRTVKGEPALDIPLTVTTTLPVVAPAGTATTICVLFQLVIDIAAVPLKVTVLEPCVAPKFVPAIVTKEPAGPEVVFRLESTGDAELTAKVDTSETPPAVTTVTLAAPGEAIRTAGTAAVNCVALM
jgi:hypothetical protein